MCLNLNENILGRKNQQSKTLVKKRGGGGGLCLAFRVNMDLMELSHG